MFALGELQVMRVAGVHFVGSAINDPRGRANRKVIAMGAVPCLHGRKFGRMEPIRQMATEFCSLAYGGPLRYSRSSRGGAVQ